MTQPVRWSAWQAALVLAWAAACGLPAAETRDAQGPRADASRSDGATHDAASTRDADDASAMLARDAAVGADVVTPTDVPPARDAAMAPRPPSDEFAWIDQDITWDYGLVGQDVARMPPSNWYAPIDYADGQIEMRLTVQSKADATPVWLELCMWQGYLGSANHTCLHCIDPPFTATGEYTCHATPDGPVDYHLPFVAMEHRIKDGSHGRGNDLNNLHYGLPVTAHYTIVLVPAGHTFSGWDHYPIH